MNFLSSTNEKADKALFSYGSPKLESLSLSSKVPKVHLFLLNGTAKAPLVGHASYTLPLFSIKNNHSPVTKTTL